VPGGKIRSARTTILRSEITQCGLLSAALAASVMAAASQPGITVLVYDYAEIPLETLTAAQHETAAIFKTAGIEIEWRHGFPARKEPNPAYPQAGGLDKIDVLILSREMVSRLKPGLNDLARGLVPDNGGFGTVVYIYADRCRDLLTGPRWAYGVILGHILAHELGHLLLGHDAHRTGSIMQRNWGENELCRTLQRRMLFPSWQAEQMRTQIVARMGDRATRLKTPEE
jgi:hypothetical protein